LPYLGVISDQFKSEEEYRSKKFLKLLEEAQFYFEPKAVLKFYFRTRENN